MMRRSEGFSVRKGVLGFGSDGVGVKMDAYRRNGHVHKGSGDVHEVLDHVHNREKVCPCCKIVCPYSIKVRLRVCPWCPYYFRKGHFS